MYLITCLATALVFALFFFPLQAAIAAMKEQDFGIPLQFNNFRD